MALAQAFGIPSRRIAGADFARDIDAVLSADGPQLCRVMLDPGQGFEPRTSSRRLEDGSIVSAPLEDMYPFLDAAELARNRWPEDGTA